MKSIKIYKNKYLKIDNFLLVVNFRQLYFYDTKYNNIGVACNGLGLIFALTTSDRLKKEVTTFYNNHIEYHTDYFFFEISVVDNGNKTYFKYISTELFIEWRKNSNKIWVENFDKYYKS